MDVTKQIQSLIDSLKAEKSMAQPWKNYAVSDAIRLQAVIAQGLSSSNQKPPPEFLHKNEGAAVAGCTCVPGQKASVHCPVHGINV